MLPMRCWREDCEVHEAERIELALAAALDKLAPEERLVLKLHFTDGHQVSNDLTAADARPARAVSAD